MLTDADILDALRVCYDPEMQINIVDLGRVHDISVSPDARAPAAAPRTAVTIVLLPRSEPQDSMLSAQVTNRLLGLRDVSAVSITYAQCAWTSDCMSPSAKLQRSHQQGLIQLGTPGERPDSAVPNR